MYSMFPEGLEVVGHCVECGREIYGGNEQYMPEEYYEFEDDMVCEDCLRDYCNKHFLVSEY